MEIFVNFPKKKHLLHFETTMILFDFILHFWRSKILLSQTLFLFFQVALCNQPTIVLRHWKRYRTGTFKPYSTPLWTIGFSTVTYIELWWSVKDLQRNALNLFFFNVIFPAFIDKPNNTEINRLIKLVVSGTFLLPESASLTSLVSFLGNSA